MSTLTYPSEQLPAPPAVTIEVPEAWESVSVPGVAIAVKAPEREDFTPNVIVRVGTRRALDQLSDIVAEVHASIEGRTDAQIGEAETVEVGGGPWVRIAVAWTDPNGLPIRQVNLSRGIPRDDSVQHFIHLTGSAGGAGAEADLPLVEQVLASVRLG